MAEDSYVEDFELLLEDWTDEWLTNADIDDAHDTSESNDQSGKPTPSRKRKVPDHTGPSQISTAKVVKTSVSRKSKKSGIYSSCLWQLAKHVEIISKELPRESYELPVGDEKLKIDKIFNVPSKLEASFNGADFSALKELFDEHCNESCEMRSYTVPQEGVPQRRVDKVVPRDRIYALFQALIESLPDAVLTTGQVRLRRTYPRSVGFVFIVAGTQIKSIYEDKLESEFSDPSSETVAKLRSERQEVMKFKLAGVSILTLDADLKVANWDHISIEIPQA